MQLDRFRGLPDYKEISHGMSNEKYYAEKRG
jgi:aminoglycoside phosphotransferase (APT) family kinase protein